MSQQVVKAAWENVVEDQRRADFLDFLYEQDGRGSKDHPLHSLYTGLYVQWQADGSKAAPTAVLSSDVLADLSPCSVSV